MPFPSRLRARALARHEHAVYRYAYALLGDAGDAADVTEAALADARALSGRSALIDIAHLLCRELVEAELGPAALAEAERDEARRPEGICADAELAVSLALDGRLSRGERAGLREHLVGCRSCRGWARSLVAQRAALAVVLGAPRNSRAAAVSIEMKDVPVPHSPGRLAALRVPETAGPVVPARPLWTASAIDAGGAPLRRRGGAPPPLASLARWWEAE